MIRIYLQILMLVILTGCSGWTYNGIRGADLQKAKGKELAIMVAGSVASAGIHFLGHAAWLDINGKNWHMDGLSEMCNDPLDDREMREFGRAGAVAQLAGGWIMRLSGVDNSFTRGYNTWTAAEIILYPITTPLSGTKGSDIRLINDGGGSAIIEWGIYSALAASLNVK